MSFGERSQRPAHRSVRAPRKVTWKVDTESTSHVAVHLRHTYERVYCSPREQAELRYARQLYVASVRARCQSGYYNFDYRASPQFWGL